MRRRGPGRAGADRGLGSGAAGVGPGTRRMSGASAAQAETGEAEAEEGEGGGLGYTRSPGCKRSKENIVLVLISRDTECVVPKKACARVDVRSPAFPIVEPVVRP